MFREVPRVHETPRQAERPAQKPAEELRGEPRQRRARESYSWLDVRVPAESPRWWQKPAAVQLPSAAEGTVEKRVERWAGAAHAVDRLRAYAEADRLDRSQRAAVRLGERLAESRVEAGDREPRPAHLVRTLTAARELARELDIAESVGVLPESRRNQMWQQLDRLAECLGTDLEHIAARTREPRWLDVASPAHGQVNVAGARTFFRPHHVAATEASAVVVANDCRLETVEHYHVRRVSLDCRSLYRDKAAVEAFAAMRVEPTEERIAAFRAELRRIANPMPEPGGQVYRERLPVRVNTHLEHPDVAILGDDSHVRSTTRYHIRETVVPLADLLDSRADLVRALAGSHGDAGLEKPIVRALGDIEEFALLGYARQLDDGRTTVRRSLDARRVDLAAALMIGAGNTLTRSSEVQAGRARAGNLARFDRLVRQAVEQAEEAPA